MTTKEQIEELLKDIPKTYNMVSAYSSVNVKDLEEAVDRFKYVPSYQDLLEENNKQQNEIDRLNNIIEELEKNIDEALKSKDGEKYAGYYMAYNQMKNRIKELKGDNK